MDTVVVDVGTATVNLAKWDGRALQVEKLPTGDPITELPQWLDLLSPRRGFEFRYSSTRVSYTKPEFQRRVFDNAVHYGASQASAAMTNGGHGPGLHALRWLAGRHRLEEALGVDVGASSYRSRQLHLRGTEPECLVWPRTANRVDASRLNDAATSFAKSMRHDLAIVDSSPLVCSGGDGPFHAAEFAAQLGRRRVIVPDYAGCFEAIGLVCMPKVFQVEQPMHDHPLSMGPLRDAFCRLMEEISGRISMDGLDFDDVTCAQWIAVRRVGETAERCVPCESSTNERDVAQSFARRIESGNFDPQDLLMCRAIASAHQDQLSLDLPPPPLATVRRTTARSGADIQSQFMHRRMVERSDLAPGATLHGPAAIREPWHVTIVPDGWIAEVAMAGGMVLTMPEGK
ncbi:MAG: hypothetical protein HZA51_18090 [Planctomycetes bacterium]|nr:hypothetical protein [Planctomycetota bacterium]